MEYFFGKNEISVKLWFKGINYRNFHIFIVTNFKTDRYLNNFQEHLFGILRLRKYETHHFKISFPCGNEAIKHDLVEFKVQCLKVFCYHGNKSTILLFYSIFITTPEVSSKLYFVGICWVSEKLWLFNCKRADFWLPNFGFKRSLLSLLNCQILGFSLINNFLRILFILCSTFE